MKDAASLELVFFFLRINVCGGNAYTQAEH